jgi:hypothetical protein
MIRADVAALRRSRLGWAKRNHIRADTLTSAQSGESGRGIRRMAASVARVRFEHRWMVRLFSVFQVGVKFHGAVLAMAEPVRGAQ